MQLVFQDPLRSLDPDLTVAELVGEPLDVAGGCHAAERDERVRRSRCGWSAWIPTPCCGRRPRQLSGGQRQRVSLARAIVTRPQLLFCDEPVSALDVSNRNLVLSLLDRLRTELGLAVVIIAHDLSSLAGIADRVAVFYRSRIVEQGPIQAVLEHPAHPYTGAADGLGPQRAPRGPAAARAAAPRARRPAVAHARACASSPPAAASPTTPASSSRPRSPWRARGRPPATWPARGARSSPRQAKTTEDYRRTASTPPPPDHQESRTMTHPSYDDVEFLGMIGTSDGSEIRPASGPVVDPDYTARFARAHEDGGFDRVLIGYGSGWPEGSQVAAYAAAHTERLGLLVAHRPGFVAPDPGRAHLRHPRPVQQGPGRACTSSPAATTPSSAATATTCTTTSATPAPTSTSRS